MVTDAKTLTRAADNIRVLSAAMVEKAKSGHPGGAMGGADFVNVLYSKFLVYDPDDATWPWRDRFFLDPGHMSPMLYSVLALAGRYTIAELQQFRQWGSVTPGHPEVDPARGIENTSGPLGQGHTMAVGAAIAERFLVARFGETCAHKTYAFISDGGIQEEISQGAGRIAGFLGLANLIMFYDANGVQLSTDVDAVDEEDYAAKYRAWGWNVLEINGNDPDEIAHALAAAHEETKRPTLIIGRTVMGLGARNAKGEPMEGLCSTHGQPLSKAGVDMPETYRNLGADPDDPFRFFPEAEALYAARAEELRKIVAERREAHARWAQDHTAEAATLKGYLEGYIPEIDYAAIIHKADVATRTASADVLGVLAEKVENMIVSSADLANSDKTDGFLKKTQAFAPHDFSGAFLHAGVAELTMAAIMNGIALHGACIAACGTFFVFSDYQKPAIRMSALMELPVKYIWSHDAFRVGEDGPTHEPIEQEAQLRLLEEIRNFSGERSMLVLRPADAAETSYAWQMAMGATKRPTGLITSRQDIKDLPAPEGTSRIEAARGTLRGGYTALPSPGGATPDVVLVANGSEVSLLCDVRALLAAEGIKASVVSVPSTGLFNDQDEAYRLSVLPLGIPQLGLTAGLPDSLRLIDGFNGKIYAMNRFGASAPYKVLDEKFGYTPENILSWVKSNLGIENPLRENY
ncbi:MAG: transketolase [Muribaculaceae bacterium]|nr:transketolase [Muribaculaceae bacterium]